MCILSCPTMSSSVAVPALMQVRIEILMCLPPGQTETRATLPIFCLKIILPQERGGKCLLRMQVMSMLCFEGMSVYGGTGGEQSIAKTIGQQGTTSKSTTGTSPIYQTIQNFWEIVLLKTTSRLEGHRCTGFLFRQTRQ